jgi:ribosomal protein S12 methylthiotransferase accessory factor
VSGIHLFDRTLAARKRLTDGTHRAAPLAETLARARRLMAPLGITRLADLTGLDVIGVPVWAAFRPNGRSLATSQGKGLSAEAAQVSALMESIETWHAEELARDPGRKLVTSTARRLAKRAPVVNLAGLPREGRGRPDPNRRTVFVEGWDLVAGAPCWVPLEAVTLDCVLGRRRPVFAVTSTGLASGNHVLEAIVHGLCEVLERDAEARWRRARGQTRVDLATVTDPGCRTLLDRLAAARQHVTVWDMTSDTCAPAYAAAIMEDPREPAWRGLGLYQGFGCHLSPTVALARALTEAIQTRAAYIAGSRDDFLPADYARSRDEALMHAIWADVTRPAHGGDGDTVTLDAWPDLAAPSFEADVRTLVGLCRNVGCDEVVVVDLTRADLGVPVVKVLVPGRARHVDWMA